MDELNEKLSSILGDPDSMSRLRAMAQNILGGEKKEEQGPENETGIDLAAVTKLMSLVNKGSGDDSRIKLLKALKPNLSPERQGRVDSAIKILRLLELMPLIKESGLFDM